MCCFLLVLYGQTGQSNTFSFCGAASPEVDGGAGGKMIDFVDSVTDERILDLTLLKFSERLLDKRKESKSCPSTSATFEEASRVHSSGRLKPDCLLDLSCSRPHDVAF